MNLPDFTRTGLDPASGHFTRGGIPELERINRNGGSDAIVKGVSIADLQPWFGIREDHMPFIGDQAFVTRRQESYLYRGRAPVIEQNIVGLILKNTEAILSAEYGAPPVETDSMKFTVSTLIFDEGLLDVEPEEGVARHMRFSEKSASGTLIRKSKGMYFEHGFFFSPEGQARYYQQQIQLTNCIINDQIYNTLVALRDSRIEALSDQARNGEFNASFRNLVIRKYKDFARFQKYEDAPFVMENSATAILELRGAKANVIVCSRGLEYFWQGASDDQRSYEKSGPEALKRRRTDPMTITSFNRLKIIFTRLFLNQEAGQYPVDPLIRTRFIGEYAIMAPSSLCHVDSEYKTSDRNIKIINLDKNTWGTITLKQALHASMIFSDNGELLVNDPRQGPHPHGDMFSMKLPKSFGNIEDPIVVEKNATTIFGEISEHVIPNEVFLTMAEQVHKKHLHGAILQFCISGDIGNYKFTDINFTADNVMSGLATEPAGASLVPTSVDLNTIHEDNIRSLSPEIVSTYNTVKELNIVNDEKLAHLTNHVLQSKHDSTMDILSKHLATLADSNISQKRKSDSIKYFESFNVPSHAANVTSPTSKTTINVLNVDEMDRFLNPSSNKTGMDGHGLIEKQKEVNAAMIVNRIKSLIAQAGRKEMIHAIICVLILCLKQDSFEFLLDNHIFYPFTHLVFRPWVQLVTSTVITMQGGAQTIVNLYMKPDVMMDDNATTKTHSAHMTVNLSPFVRKPLNIVVDDDVAIRRYVAGCTTQPYTFEELKRVQENGYFPGTDPNQPSWFSRIVPITMDDIYSAIDFRGFFNDEQTSENFKPHFYTTRSYLDELFDGHPENISPYYAAEEYTGNEVLYNSVCVQCTQLCYNKNKKEFSAVITGDDSALGVNVYHGMRTVIEGLQKTFKDQEYGNVSKFQPYESYHV